MHLVISFKVHYIVRFVVLSSLFSGGATIFYWEIIYVISWNAWYWLLNSPCQIVWFSPRP